MTQWVLWSDVRLALIQEEDKLMREAMEQARERQRQFEESQRRWQEQMQMGATSNNATAEVRIEWKL